LGLATLPAGAAVEDALLADAVVERASTVRKVLKVRRTAFSISFVPDILPFIYASLPIGVRSNLSPNALCGVEFHGGARHLLQKNDGINSNIWPT
jgi:hypothetical protein